MKMPKSKLLNLPFIQPIVRKYVNYRVTQESINIANHYDKFLNSILALSASQRDEVHRIRYDVYCTELSFEPPNEHEREKDEFDSFSDFCMVQHRSSDVFAGCVRIVTPRESEDQLPIEKFCLDSITDQALSPTNFERDNICEVSRLAVPEVFRRRNSDKFEGAATGAFNEEVYSETEMRCFPFIAIGLYINACHTIKLRGIKHVYVMMEPRLARSLRMVGGKFKKIGPVVEYHGKRAPYYVTPDEFLAGLSPGFKVLSNNIARSLAQQRDSEQ